MSRQHKIFSDRSLRTAVHVPGVLGVGAFWAGMLIAMHLYPGEYDWRYMTVSSLTSPARDPLGHLWASAGMVLCGTFGLWWATELTQNWNYADGRLRGIRAIWSGVFFMAGAALLPSSLLGIHKGHELLALLAFIGWCIGILQLAFRATDQALRPRLGGTLHQARLYATMIVGAAVSPIILAGSAQAYVRYALPNLHWVSLTWRTRGIPAYLSFAFWEWATCAVLSTYMIGISFAVRLGASVSNETAAEPRGQTLNRKHGRKC